MDDGVVPDAVLLAVPREALLAELLLDQPGTFDPPRLRGPDIGTAVSLLVDGASVVGGAATIAVAKDEIREVFRRLLRWTRRSHPSARSVTLTYRSERISVSLEAADGQELEQQLLALLAAAGSGSPGQVGDAGSEVSR